MSVPQQRPPRAAFRFSVCSRYLVIHVPGTVPTSGIVGTFTGYVWGEHVGTSGTPSDGCQALPGISGPTTITSSTRQASWGPAGWTPLAIRTLLPKSKGIQWTAKARNRCRTLSSLCRRGAGSLASSHSSSPRYRIPWFRIQDVVDPLQQEPILLGDVI
jgi:hypothetical protein